MNKILIRSLLLVQLIIINNYCFADSLLEEDQFRVEVEGSVVSQSNNDVRIPNDGGTKFDLDSFNSSTDLSSRYTLEYQIKNNHQLRVLGSFYGINGERELEENINFQDQDFQENVATTSRWKFNTYRLGYRYTFYDQDRINLKVGGTFLIRDAKIELSQFDRSAVKNDIGVVPLLSLFASYKISDDFRFQFDFEGAGASQGRALDALLSARYNLNDNLELGLGYRTLEGGADSDEVYNFSWSHYASALIAYKF